MADEIKKVSLGIKVDDGFRRVPITNMYDEEIGVFYFNPTDIGIIERFNNMAASFESVTEQLNAVSDDVDEADEVYIKAIDEATERLYEAVNDLFGGDFASAFFGKTKPFSPVGGLFYCEQALNAVGQYISEQFDAETAKFEERIKKYTQNRAQRRAAKKK